MLHAILIAALAFAPASIVSDDPPPAAKLSADAPKVYDESADAKLQIAAAIAKAKSESPNKRVLIQWGGNWCPWCIKLDALYKSDKDIKRELNYEYVTVFVDSSGKGDPKKNIEFAKTFGADLATHGYPFLTILDADGKPIVNQETDSLESKDSSGKSVGIAAGHDPAKVLKFLRDHEPNHPTAQSLFDKGIANAKASGKTAFVHFGAPWCGWCHKLENWMAKPEIAAILAKDFVDLKIDTERTDGGQKMLDTMSDMKSGGIPWMVFVGGDGKAIINSNADGKNIGYPGEKQEIAHFAAMLGKVRKNMTEADVKTLVASLESEAPH